MSGSYEVDKGLAACMRRAQLVVSVSTTCA